MILFKLSKFLSNCHNIKSICIWSLSSPYFPAFGMNTEMYRVNLRKQSECGKIRTRKTPKWKLFAKYEHSRNNSNNKNKLEKH